MEPARSFLRPLAIVSAIVLVGGFVYYRSGGLGFLSGSKSNPVFSTIGTPSPANSTPQDPSPDFMAGSKSTFIFVGPSIKPPNAEAPVNQPDASPPMIPPAKP